MYGGPAKKKWSPVDRMLAEKRGRTANVSSTGNEKVDCSTQTTALSGPCQDKGCVKEKEFQSHEVKELKRRIRDIKKRLNEKEREFESYKAQQVVTIEPPTVGPPPNPRPAPPPNIIPKPPKEQPADIGLLAKLEELERENNRLKSSLHHAYERSNYASQLEMEKSKLIESLEREKQLNLALKKEKVDLEATKLESDEKIKELEMKLHMLNGNNDDYMAQMESDQKELIRRVNVLQNKILPSIEIAHRSRGLIVEKKATM